MKSEYAVSKACGHAVWKNMRGDLDEVTAHWFVFISKPLIILWLVKGFELLLIIRLTSGNKYVYTLYVRIKVLHSSYIFIRNVHEWEWTNKWLPLAL